MVDKAVVWHHRLVLHNESPNHPRQRLKHFRLKFAKIWLVGFPHAKREERNPWSSLSTDLSKGISQSISHAMKKGNEWKGGSQFVQQIKERRKQVITVQTVMLACAQHLAFDFSIKPIKWWQRYWQSVVDSEYGPKIDDQISVELSEKKGKTKRPPLFFTFFYFSSVIQDNHGKKKLLISICVYYAILVSKWSLDIICTKQLKTRGIFYTFHFYFLLIQNQGSG